MLVGCLMTQQLLVYLGEVSAQTSVPVADPPPLLKLQTKLAISSNHSLLTPVDLS